MATQLDVCSSAINNHIHFGDNNANGLSSEFVIDGDTLLQSMHANADTCKSSLDFTTAGSSIDRDCSDESVIMNGSGSHKNNYGSKNMDSPKSNTTMLQYSTSSSNHDAYNLNINTNNHKHDNEVELDFNESMMIHGYPKLEEIIMSHNINANIVEESQSFNEGSLSYEECDWNGINPLNNINFYHDQSSCDYINIMHHPSSLITNEDHSSFPNPLQYPNHTPFMPNIDLYNPNPNSPFCKVDGFNSENIYNSTLNHYTNMITTSQVPSSSTFEDPISNYYRTPYLDHYHRSHFLMNNINNNGSHHNPNVSSMDVDLSYSSIEGAQRKRHRSLSKGDQGNGGPRKKMATSPSCCSSSSNYNVNMMNMEVQPPSMIKASNSSSSTEDNATPSPPPPAPQPKSRSKQPSANDPQSVAARHRRERISERLKTLQELVPNGSKVDLVTMLEKAINYVKFLQLQVKVLTNDEYWPNCQKLNQPHHITLLKLMMQANVKESSQKQESKDKATPTSENESTTKPNV